MKNAGLRVDMGKAGREIARVETMLVKSDSRGRLPLRGFKKNRRYLVMPSAGGWWVAPASKAISPAPETSPAEAWELRAATLESFYDPAKTW